MVKGAPMISSRTRETMMLGEVPMSVMVPPINEAKAMGINTRCELLRWRRASCAATGMKIARAPMFFIRADITATVPPRKAIWRPGVFRWGATGRTRTSTTPERATPALTTRAEPIMITISSANPLNAFSAGTRPVKTAASSARTATTS